MSSLNELHKTATSLQLRRVFPVTPQRLFDAWTSAEALAAWFQPGPGLRTLARLDLRVGGRYRIEMHPAPTPVEEGAAAGEAAAVTPAGAPYIVEGTYQVIEPPQRLVFTWHWTTSPEAVSLVSLTFKALGPGETEFVLRHERLADEAARDSHAAGWRGIVNSLAGFVGAV